MRFKATDTISATIRRSRSAAPLKHDDGVVLDVVGGGDPPITNRGPLEAGRRVITPAARTTDPPITIGGPIEAPRRPPSRCGSRSDPPITIGGPIEATDALGFGYLRLQRSADHDRRPH